MKTTEFPEMNGGLGAPADWDEKAEGPCGYLPTHHDGRAWTSRWKPTEEELAILNDGGHVYLGVVIGDRPQPPVHLYAGYRLWAKDGKRHDVKYPDAATKPIPEHIRSTSG